MKRARAKGRVALVAGFFCLLALEYASPQFCPEKLATMFGGGAVTAVAVSDRESAVADATPASLGTSESPDGELPLDDCEDCVCCCSHVLVALGSSPAVVPVEAALILPGPLAFPSTPPPGTFRPPRAV